MSVEKSINSTLTAYNKSCAEMGSEARDAFIRDKLEESGDTSLLEAYI
jgi:hypothetical protein